VRRRRKRRQGRAWPSSPRRPAAGPLYEDEGEALNVYAGLVGDHRPGHIFLPPVEDRFCRLVCRMKDTPRRRPKSVQPVFSDGERWPSAKAPLETVWQLSVSYWKILDGAPVARAEPGDVRTLRKRAKTGELSVEEMRSLMAAPLTAPRPQKALDFGLFDFVPPDDPGIVIADE
jgi:hypothetical protein